MKSEHRKQNVASFPEFLIRLGSYALVAVIERVAEMRTDGTKILSSIFTLYSGVAFLSITAVFFVPKVHRLLHILHVEGNADETQP